MRLCFIAACICCHAVNHVGQTKQSTPSEQNPSNPPAIPPPNPASRKEEALKPDMVVPPSDQQRLLPDLLGAKELSMAFHQRVSNKTSSLDVFIRVSPVCVSAYLRMTPLRHLHRARSVAISAVDVHSPTDTPGLMEAPWVRLVRYLKHVFFFANEKAVYLCNR